MFAFFLIDGLMVEFLCVCFFYRFVSLLLSFSDEGDDILWCKVY